MEGLDMMYDAFVRPVCNRVRLVGFKGWNPDLATRWTFPILSLWNNKLVVKLLRCHRCMFLLASSLYLPDVIY